MKRLISIHGSGALDYLNEKGEVKSKFYEL
jgi:hypothetical protein